MFGVQNCEWLGYVMSLASGSALPQLREWAQPCAQASGTDAASGRGGSFCGSALEVQVNWGLRPWVG